MISRIKILYGSTEGDSTTRPGMSRTTGTLANPPPPIGQAKSWYCFQVVVYISNLKE